MLDVFQSKLLLLLLLLATTYLALGSAYLAHDIDNAAVPKPSSHLLSLVRFAIERLHPQHGGDIDVGFVVEAGRGVLGAWRVYRSMQHDSIIQTKMLQLEHVDRLSSLPGLILGKTDNIKLSVAVFKAMQGLGLPLVRVEHSNEQQQLTAIAAAMDKTETKAVGNTVAIGVAVAALTRTKGKSGGERGDALQFAARCFMLIGQHATAVKLLDKSLIINPNLDRSVCMLVSAKESALDWSHREETFDLLAKTIRKLRSNHPWLVPLCVSPFFSLVYPLDPRTTLLIAATSAQLLTATPALKPPLPIHHRPLIVGYLSSEFGDNSVGREITAVIENHRREYVHPVCLILPSRPGTGGSPSSERWRHRASKACMQSLHISPSWSDVDAASNINSLGTDIIVDLNGWMDGHRSSILAHKPAPIQIGYKNYVGSMGADFVEFLASDRVATPPEYAADYTERLLYLPHSFYATANMAELLAAQHLTTRKQSRDILNIPSEETVFCNFNNYRKFDPDAIQAWASVMNQVGNSSLWLMQTWSSNTIQNKLRQIFASLGIADESRIHITEMLPDDRHLTFKAAAADIFLDTFIYNGHSTSVEILYAGVMVVSVPGRRMAARVGVSILSAASLSVLVARNHIDFVELTVALTKKKKKLKTEDIGSSPLFDHVNWTHDWERLLMMTSQTQEQRHIILAKR